MSLGFLEINSFLKPSCRPAKHTVGYDSGWEKESPWPKPNENGTASGILCQLCSCRKTKWDTTNHSSVWSKKACTYLREDSIKHREASEQHLEVVNKLSLLDASLVMVT